MLALEELCLEPEVVVTDLGEETFSDSRLVVAAETGCWHLQFAKPCLKYIIDLEGQQSPRQELTSALLTFD